MVASTDSSLSYWCLFVNTMWIRAPEETLAHLPPFFYRLFGSDGGVEEVKLYSHMPRAESKLSECCRFAVFF